MTIDPTAPPAAPAYRLVVTFSTGRTYQHAVRDDREAQATIDGWARAGGLWVIDGAAGLRVWCPWHTVAEVNLPRPPHATVVGGRGPAVRPARPPAPKLAPLQETA